LILLDTHVLVWMVGAPERVSPAAAETIASAAQLAISLASIQEIAYLVVRGRLDMDRPVEQWMADALNVYEIRGLPSTVSATLRAGSLDPKEFHGDPIDRLIYATAVENDARLITADDRLRRFDPQRTVW
jgi:PIN domain nuclease of toxin-antitoxin system